MKKKVPTKKEHPPITVTMTEKEFDMYKNMKRHPIPAWMNPSELLYVAMDICKADDKTYGKGKPCFGCGNTRGKGHKVNCFIRNLRRAIDWNFFPFDVEKDKDNNDFNWNEDENEGEQK